MLTEEEKSKQLELLSLQLRRYLKNSIKPWGDGDGFAIMGIIEPVAIVEPCGNQKYRVRYSTTNFDSLRQFPSAKEALRYCWLSRAQSFLAVNSWAYRFFEPSRVEAVDLVIQETFEKAFEQALGKI